MVDDLPIIVVKMKVPILYIIIFILSLFHPSRGFQCVYIPKFGVRQVETWYTRKTSYMYFYESFTTEIRFS